MKYLITLLKKLPIRSILNIFLAGIFLLVITACSGADKLGANPQNPAVQASLFSNPQILLASTKQSEILYPGAETPAGRVKKEAELPIITEEDFQHPEPGGLIQRDSDLGTRIQERIDTVKEAVKDASGFLQDKADEASVRPELQKNSAVGK
ncbi:hypothetical protein B6N60_01856 [Richelia sinica FACHB-800]|uniref:DUF3035 domain-containing protein n=1 Tax=Richelia sinica FACHB-800 TaxID=1357546 RepID=A0A975T6R2_9NOST|nr:DUF6658 family protein [Richelia sinica]MBD2664729.1 hypothetical protein [Richelia sinica FACHB-800]QXE23167.1 hypothetical protein B6N60_01856 [Richelia sinica FACHB-800]